MGGVNAGCAPFCGVGGVGGRSYAGGCPFAVVGVNQPVATDAATPVAFENGTFKPASRQNLLDPCLLGRNKISSKQPVAPGTQQPERLTMSTNILSPADDTAGLAIEDAGVLRAFAIMASIGITFAASAALAIASIA